MRNNSATSARTEPNSSTTSINQVPAENTRCASMVSYREDSVALAHVDGEQMLSISQHEPAPAAFESIDDNEVALVPTTLLDPGSGRLG